ncbi:hypothetical protein [Paenibacillus sp. GXUN7292]|uniref:hypothetical protein n=1 Tax=Paenibacillus sp. GXUN7292 TaxID=3422499 RepID=UPI003D7E2251
MYYYCLLEKGDIVDVAVTADQARQRFILERDRVITPMIRTLEYEMTSDDFKGVVNDLPYLLYLDIHSGGTVYGPVVLVDDGFNGWLEQLRGLGARITSPTILKLRASGYSQPVRPEVMELVYEYWMIKPSKAHIQPAIEQLQDPDVDADLIDALFPSHFTGALRAQWDACWASKQRDLSHSQV